LFCGSKISPNSDPTHKAPSPTSSSLFDCQRNLKPIYRSVQNPALISLLIRKGDNGVPTLPHPTRVMKNIYQRFLFFLKADELSLGLVLVIRTRQNSYEKKKRTGISHLINILGPI
jgi:hypothetical protein